MATCEPIPHTEDDEAEVHLFEDDEVEVFDPYEGMDSATRLLVRKLQCEDEQQRSSTKRQRRLDAEDQASLELARQLHQQELQEQASLKLARNLQQYEDVVTNQAYHKRSKEEVLDSLEECQRTAIEHVQTQAKRRHEHALSQLRSRVSSLGYESSDLDRCLTYIREDAPIVIHFAQNTLSLLVEDTHYRNLFETNTSGGTANLSSRVTWEQGMFGNAYDSCDAFDRPKYGCLNLTGDIRGVRVAASYGTFFLTLKTHVRNRTTFFGRDTGGIKFDDNESLATNEYYAHVLQSYTDAELQAVLGVSRIGGAPSTAITVYKEVQIHGPVCLANDIQSLSVPGRESAADDNLKQLVDKFQKKTGCNILWQEDLLNSS